MVRTTLRLRRAALIAAPLAAGWLVLAAAAQAQVTNAIINTNSASFNAGFGRSSDQENAAVNVQMSDANGNTTIENGLITGAVQGSIFANAGASASASGAFDSFSGAGSASASAIGNSLNVVTNGNNNTVIVNSIQNNSGDVSATTNVNGKP
jgi:holdfast attachment protein HfaA